MRPGTCACGHARRHHQKNLAHKKRWGQCFALSERGKFCLCMKYNRVNLSERGDFCIRVRG